MVFSLVLRVGGDEVGAYIDRVILEVSYVSNTGLHLLLLLAQAETRCDRTYMESSIFDFSIYRNFDF